MSCLGVQVQVKRRETERQQESRLNSYAYPGRAGAAGALVCAAGHPAAGGIIDTMLYKAMEMMCPWS